MLLRSTKVLITSIILATTASINFVEHVSAQTRPGPIKVDPGDPAPTGSCTPEKDDKGKDKVDDRQFYICASTGEGCGTYKNTTDPIPCSSYKISCRVGKGIASKRTVVKKGCSCATAEELHKQCKDAEDSPVQEACTMLTSDMPDPKGGEVKWPPCDKWKPAPVQVTDPSDASGGF